MRPTGRPAPLAKWFWNAYASSGDLDAASRRQAACLRQIEKAAEWWSYNRPAAPGAIRLDLQGALRVLAEHPGIGTRVENDRKVHVRRLYLTRVRYFIYYRVTGQSLDVIAFWHERRATEPRV